MKAAVIDKYGDYRVVKVEDIAKPVISTSKQILVKVIASSVNSGDARIRRADPWLVRLMYGLIVPKLKVLGIVYAGIVEGVGSSNLGYKIGDRVYGMNEVELGGHAEYILLDSSNPIGKMPVQMSFADAASLPFGATTALHYLEGIELKNKKVLIIGASGAVGVNLLQIAKCRGAVVTTVSSFKNIELLKKLGANYCVSYSSATNINFSTINQTASNESGVNKVIENGNEIDKADTTQRGEKLPDSEFDIVIDCVNKMGVDQLQKLVKKNGYILLVAGLVKEMISKVFVKKATIVVGPAKVLQAHYTQINEMYLEKKLIPIIQEILPLDQISLAHKIVDEGHKVGSVVVDML